MRRTLLEKTASYAEADHKEVCENVSGDWGGLLSTVKS